MRTPNDEDRELVGRLRQLADEHKEVILDFRKAARRIESADESKKNDEDWELAKRLWEQAYEQEKVAEDLRMAAGWVENSAGSKEDDKDQQLAGRQQTDEHEEVIEDLRVVARVERVARNKDELDKLTESLRDHEVQHRGFADRYAQLVRTAESLRDQGSPG